MVVWGLFFGSEVLSLLNTTIFQLSGFLNGNHQPENRETVDGSEPSLILYGTTTHDCMPFRKYQNIKSLSTNQIVGTT